MSRSLAALGIAVALVATGALAAEPVSAGLLPVAVNDSYTAVHGKLRTVAAPGVLGNDLQLGSGFTAKLVNGVDHGSLHLNANGSFTYTPNAKYTGADTFTYKVDGGALGISNVATVTITVTNAAPVAHPDAYSAIADVDKSVKPPGVLSNDDDADGDHLTIAVVQKPAHGNLDAHSDGSFKYKADKGFSGTDTWTYRVWDGVAWSNVVTVTMNVSLSASPSPTASPTPRPTPRPTPTPTPRPTPRPTPKPLISIPPLPSIVPLPTPVRTASPTPRPTPSPSARPAATPPPTPVPTGAAGAGVLVGGPVATPSDGPTARPPTGSASSGVAGEPAFTVPEVDRAEGLVLDTADVTFAGFEWAVPALVLTVPGILIVIAVLAQTLIGLAWLPVARRWLGGDEHGRSRARVGAR